MKYTLQVEMFPGATSAELGAILTREGREWTTLHTDDGYTPLVSQSRFVPIERVNARGYWSLEE